KQLEQALKNSAGGSDRSDLHCRVSTLGRKQAYLETMVSGTISGYLPEGVSCPRHFFLQPLNGELTARMEQLRIAIVGYGTAGQAAAVLLTRDGHDVSVFERVPEPGPVGAGFLLQPSGLQVLWRMGLLPSVMAHGARVDRLFGDTPCGRPVMDMRYAGMESRVFGVGLQRGALFSILDAAWPGRASALHAGCDIVDVDAEAGLLRDARGEVHGPFDLVVVADGAASRLRGRISAPRVDKPYPWGALWCLLPAGKWPHVAELRQRYVAARKMIGLLPVGGRPGDPTRRLSFFWSLHTDAFQQWESAGLAPWMDELHTLWPEACDV